MPDGIGHDSILRLSFFTTFLFFNSVVAEDSKLLRHSQDRPKIVIIVADDLGYADLGFHGSDDPNEERDVSNKRNKKWIRL